MPLLIKGKEMKKFICSADMGSAKIVGSDFNVCFSNGFGDGSFNVYIGKEAPKHKTEGYTLGAFEGHFTVKKENSVQLATYDCAEEGDNHDYFFSKGRWFVASYNGNIYINKVDEYLHS